MRLTLFKKIVYFLGSWVGARYIYRELVFPFIFSIGVVTFVLLANFLIKSVDRLLGKGLPPSLILEFLYLNLAWIIAMSIPMAVLVASLMAYGRLSEDNEIIAMRSSGISFLSTLIPGLIFGLVVGALMLYFHNSILPDFNHRARLLSGDISRKHPGLNIEPGYFNTDIPDLSIYVKERRGESLKDIIIYKRDTKSIHTTVCADSGYLSVDGNTVLFELFSGEIHELNIENLEEYRKINFNKHRMAIPVDNMILERRESARRGDREMTIAMMKDEVRKYKSEQERVRDRIEELIKKELQIELSVELRNVDKIIEKIKEKNRSELPKNLAELENRRLKDLQNRIRGEKNLLKSYQQQINRYNVEIQKKYSIPFACIVFILIGAPLGTMNRRGGMATAIILSIFFFLLYYVFLIGGEELADMAYISPFWAMWIPNIVLTILGIYLIYIETWELKSIDLFTPVKSVIRKFRREYKE